MNKSVENLYEKITTDFQFEYHGDKVIVVTDYEKADEYKKLVQLVKISEPKKSFGVHCKMDIVNYIINQ